MIEFTPTSNGSNPDAVCQGVIEWEASRGKASEAYIGVSAFLFGMACVMWGGSIPIFWVLRDSPRFHKVRPFSLNVLLAFSHISLSIGTALNPAIPNLPCGVLLFSILLGVAGFGVNIFCRLLVFVVETKFAMQTGQYTAKFEDDSSSTATPKVSGIQSLIGPSTLTTLGSIAKLALGFSAVENVTMEELSKARRIYALIALVVFCPALIPALAKVGVSVEYQRCVGCGIYRDLLILCVSAFIFYFLCCRILYVAWKLNLPDSQGVFKELVFITLGYGIPCIIGALLVLFDPGRAGYNREFAYEWILAAAGFIFWWASAGSQFLQVYRDSKRYKPSSFHTSTSRSSVMDIGDINGGGLGPDNFMDVVIKNETLYKEFEQYAIRQYAVENLYFVNDALMFKKFYHEKGDTWRKQKARVLHDTYIKHEAVMEINISQETKSRVLQRLNYIIALSSDAINEQNNEKGLSQDCYEIFDEAMDAVILDILRDIWMRFQRDRRKSTL